MSPLTNSQKDPKGVQKRNTENGAKRNTELCESRLGEPKNQKGTKLVPASEESQLKSLKYRSKKD